MIVIGGDTVCTQAPGPVWSHEKGAEAGDRLSGACFHIGGFQSESSYSSHSAQDDEVRGKVVCSFTEVAAPVSAYARLSHASSQS